MKHIVFTTATILMLNMALTAQVTKVGTTADNQIAVWTGDGTIEGTNAFRFDEAAKTLSINDLVLNVSGLTIERTLALPDVSGTLVLEETMSDYIHAGISPIDSYSTYLGYNTGKQVGGTTTLIGYGSGSAMDFNTPPENTCVGAFSGEKTTTGGYNTFIGVGAASNNTAGVFNTCLGVWAGNSIVDGLNNTIIGFNSGGSGSSVGNANTYLGAWAGLTTQGSNNVIIGYGAGSSSDLGSNKLSINNNFDDIPLIFGDFSTGQLSINTKELKEGYTLSIGGSAAAEEIKVLLRNADGSWPDYVFDDGYKLPTLQEVETYIKQNGHLQNMPSATEVVANGIELGEMNAKLLEKIEELTLYAIQQQKAMDKQKEVMGEQIIALENRLKRIEALMATKN